jgi:hypothetical protein
MEKKHAAVVLVVLGVIAGLAFRPAQWGLFTFRARDAVAAVGRFPTAEGILRLPADLRAVAERHKLDPAALEVRLALEARAMGPVLMHFVTVDARAHGRSWSYEGAQGRGHRIESAVDDAMLRALEEGGVDISRARPPATEPAEEPAEGE